MKKRKYPYSAASAFMLILFALYTLAIMLIDVKPIGPQGSSVGFAFLNGWLRDIIGVNMQLYIITDWASLAALLTMAAFALLGLVQLVKRKSLLRVDSGILALGVFYIFVMAAYLFFELNVINYRPVLIEGRLEASYPSSTTMLVMCTMPTAIMQLNKIIKNKKLKKIAAVILSSYTGLMVIGRLFSGVHWFTDIFGGMLLSAALVMAYGIINNFIAAHRPLKDELK